MSVDGFLTFLGLVIAVYTVLPRHRRLEISLNLTRLDWLVFALMIFVLLYLQFFRSFALVGWTPGWKLSRFSLNPDKAIYAICMTATLYFALVVNRRKLNSNNLRRFKELLHELVLDDNFSELFFMLSKRAKDIFALYQADGFWKKWRRRLGPGDGSPFSHLDHAILIQHIAAVERGEQPTLPKRPLHFLPVEYATKIARPRSYWILSKPKNG